MEFKEIQKIVEETAPTGKITKVDVEGPKVVLYTNDMPYFVENQNEVRHLATSLKKRIIVRATAESLMDPVDAKRRIEEIIPAEANIIGIEFDEYFSEVRIEAEKLGLVIGKHGETLDQITKATSWTPKLLRKSPLQSETVRSIRKTLFDNAKERQKLLQRVGKMIYRKPDTECDWIRVTPLGGGQQVGRSSILLQTPGSNVLLDCGINVAAQGSDRFPDFRAMKLAIN
ncbi:MAG: beta-CASP ribonuclease aCPSF1, partial [Candidatus Altiarchaeota archaeon]|nr:beta-CASP ribonuclease aCPSF1 [Candidatus Altiarchaeota archaeon]